MRTLGRDSSRTTSTAVSAMLCPITLSRCSSQPTSQESDWENSAWTWDQIDWEQGFVTLRSTETKSGHARVVPIIDGDRRRWLEWAQSESNGCERVFNRFGQPIKDFRWASTEACKVAAVPNLKFHDLRRTAVRNMRRAGVPQVVRMRITGHRTDSMERRYNIVDVDDIRAAKELIQHERVPRRRRSKAANQSTSL